MMWTTYKKEIMEREAEEADFLKKYYHHSHRQHANEGAAPVQKNDNAPKITTTSINRSSTDDDDWPVQVRFFVAAAVA